MTYEGLFFRIFFLVLLSTLLSTSLVLYNIEEMRKEKSADQMTQGQIMLGKFMAQSKCKITLEEWNEWVNKSTKGDDLPRWHVGPFWIGLGWSE